MRKLFFILLLGMTTYVAHAEGEKFVTHVTLTTYNAVASQCDSSPLITADGTKIDLKKLKSDEIKYAAVSRDLLWCIPLGSIIHIEGHGYYEVRDTMNPRFNHYIDILQHSTKKNFKKGGVKIVLVKKATPKTRKRNKKTS